MGSEKVLENFYGGPGKSWKSPGFFVDRRVGTLLKICFMLTKKLVSVFSYTGSMVAVLLHWWKGFFGL